VPSETGSFLYPHEACMYLPAGDMKSLLFFH
jgi:hypothetical protein